MTEEWTPFGSHEVSNYGRVRNARTGRVLAAKWNYDTPFYQLKGESYTQTRLVTEAWDAALAKRIAVDRHRPLTRYEMTEIKDLEGYKPAIRVAEEFRISPRRVKGIWDSE